MYDCHIQEIGPNRFPEDLKGFETALYSQKDPQKYDPNKALSLVRYLILLVESVILLNLLYREEHNHFEGMFSGIVPLMQGSPPMQSTLHLIQTFLASHLHYLLYSKMYNVHHKMDECQYYLQTGLHREL